MDTDPYRGKPALKIAVLYTATWIAPDETCDVEPANVQRLVNQEIVSLEALAGDPVNKLGLWEQEAKFAPPNYTHMDGFGFGDVETIKKPYTQLIQIRVDQIIQFP
ncbi:MAG: hypothetical protein WCW31_01540 [Patescibacteria group bacterium]|jgi:hypothetical protein